MSKSRGNVVNPDAIVKDYGADALRLYEMFMGPLEAAKPWSMEGVNGVRGFLDRVWRLIINDRAETNELHAAVKNVPVTMAPKESQDVLKEFGRAEYDGWIAKFPHTQPLDSKQMVDAFRIWDQQVGTQKTK